MKHTGRNLIILALLSLGAGLAFSADTLPTVADVEKLCKENPAKCTEVKDRIKKACDADPKKCAEVKAKIEEIQKKCETDPKWCEAEKAKLMDQAKAKQAELKGKKDAK